MKSNQFVLKNIIDSDNVEKSITDFLENSNGDLLSDFEHILFFLSSLTFNKNSMLENKDIILYLFQRGLWIIKNTRKVGMKIKYKKQISLIFYMIISKPVINKKKKKFKKDKNSYSVSIGQIGKIIKIFKKKSPNLFNLFNVLIAFFMSTLSSLLGFVFE